MKARTRNLKTLLILLLLYFAGIALVAHCMNTIIKSNTSKNKNKVQIWLN